MALNHVYHNNIIYKPHILCLTAELSSDKVHFFIKEIHLYPFFVNTMQHYKVRTVRTLSAHCTTMKISQRYSFFVITCPLSSRSLSLLRYLLCRLPEVSRVRQPAVEFGQLLQHICQLGEGRPFPQIVRPAGREDVLRQEVTLDQYTWHSNDS